jgi:hypothetical protein
MTSCLRKFLTHLILTSAREGQSIWRYPNTRLNRPRGGSAQEIVRRLEPRQILVARIVMIRVFRVVRATEPGDFGTRAVGFNQLIDCK